MVDDQSLESQMEKLLDDDGEVRRKAMRKIYKILDRRVAEGDKIPDISDFLLRVLTDKEERVREYAADAMEFLEIDLVKEGLMDALHDDSHRVRESAAVVLGPLAIEILVKTMENKDEDKRESSVNSLSNIGKKHQDKRVIAPLSKALREDNLAYSAAEGLKYFLEYSEEDDTKSDILEILISNSENGIEQTLEACYFELSKINSEYLPNSQRLHNHMIEGLSHNNDFVRRICCSFFNENHINEAEDGLIQLLSKEKNRNVKYNAIQALGLRNSFNAIPELLKNLDDNCVFRHGLGWIKREVTIQIASFNALAKIGSEDYLEQLIDLYEKFEDEEKFEVMSSLAKYKNHKVMSLFIKEMEKSNTKNYASGLFSIDQGGSLMTEAIDALSTSDDIVHLSPIVDCASDHKEYEIRRYCIRKLISDEATDVFMQNRYPVYLDDGDNTSNHEIFKKFLTLISEYLSTTNCITQEDKMLYHLGGLPATLQGEVLIRLHDTYGGILSPSYPMNEIVELWKNADYSS